MTLFVLLFMKITTYAYIFSMPSYGWIRIRIFFRIRIHQKVLDFLGFESATLHNIRNSNLLSLKYNAKFLVQNSPHYVISDTGIFYAKQDTCKTPLL
jgi:hypothetical protein